MERTLSLVLDSEGYKSLTLMKADSNEIDDFTTKTFENQEQVREYYKQKIDAFLKENEAYLSEITKKTGKNFRGRIVILEAKEKNSSLYFIEKRVLYKKHLIAFKEMVYDKPTMLKFLQLEKIGFNQYGFRKLISPFLTREITYTNYKIKSRVDFIRKEIKKNRNNFYDILRIITKAYEMERKKRNLPTIDSIYEKSKGFSKQINCQSFKEDDGKEFFCIDGFFYPIDDIPFDLDQLSRLETNYRPDGLGKDERTR